MIFTIFQWRHQTHSPTYGETRIFEECVCFIFVWTTCLWYIHLRISWVLWQIRNKWTCPTTSHHSYGMASMFILAKLPMYKLRIPRTSSFPSNFWNRGKYLITHQLLNYNFCNRGYLKKKKQIQRLMHKFRNINFKKLENRFFALIEPMLGFSIVIHICEKTWNGNPKWGIYPFSLFHLIHVNTSHSCRHFQIKSVT